MYVLCQRTAWAHVFIQPNAAHTPVLMAAQGFLYPCIKDRLSASGKMYKIITK